MNRARRQRPSARVAYFLAQSRRALCFAAAALMLAACSRGPGFTQERVYSMGTWVDITIEAPRDTASAALDDIEHMLRGFERDYYAWADDGELVRLNKALSEGKSFTASPSLAKLLVESQRVSAESGGAFDPGVGGLVELWGFNSELSGRHAPPAPEAIRAWLDSHSSISDLHIDGRKISSANRAVKLDLGGIGKGEAVDRAVALLRKCGIHNALVNAGGNMRVLGARGARPWRIGVKAPRGSGILGVIELRDGEAASTSGDYERYFEYDGKRYDHLLDPRTGYPAQGTEAVTVIADTGAEADAASTAVFVAGPARWRQVADALGLNLVLRVDGSGKIQVTEAMAKRLSAVSPGTPLTVVASEG